MVNNETLGYKTFRKGKLEYGEGRKAECSAQNWRDESWAEKRGAGKHWQQQQKVFVNTRSSSSLRKGPKAAYWNRLDLTVGDNQGRRILLEEPSCSSSSDWCYLKVYKMNSYYTIYSGDLRRCVERHCLPLKQNCQCLWGNFVCAGEQGQQHLQHLGQPAVKDGAVCQQLGDPGGGAHPQLPGGEKEVAWILKTTIMMVVLMSSRAI